MEVCLPWDRGGRPRPLLATVTATRGITTGVGYGPKGGERRDPQGEVAWCRAWDILRRMCQPDDRRQVDPPQGLPGEPLP